MTQGHPARAERSGKSSGVSGELSAVGGPCASPAGQFSWALFEWARNPYVILITIYVFAPYFTRHVVGDPVAGQALWGYANAIAGAVIAAMAPLLGAVADSAGRRKPWISGFTLILAAGSMCLWFAAPRGQEGLPVSIILALIVLNGVAYDFTNVFHNSMLPTLAPARALGRLSGLGLALGNIGGLIILIIVLWAFALPGVVDWPFVPETPLFGLDRSVHAPDRIAAPLVGIWLVIFTLPMLLLTPDSVPTGRNLRQAAVDGVRDLIATVKSIRTYRDPFRFLLARMVYNDAKGGILVFGGVYVSGLFGWDALSMVVYGITLSFFAFFGGLIGGWVDDRFGSKAAILISIGGTLTTLLLALGTTPQTILWLIPYDAATGLRFDGLPFFKTLPELVYLGTVILIAMFITAAYASSRTMLARLAPPHLTTQFFGLYALSGTATAFLAPLLVGIATDLSGSTRFGFGSLAGLLAIGLLGVLTIKSPGR